MMRELMGMFASQGAAALEQYRRAQGGGVGRSASGDVLVQPGGSSVSDTRLVLVREDGGAAGDGVTAPTITYSIWPLGGDPDVDDPLAEDVQVRRWRRQPRVILPARDDTEALAYYDGEAWVILIAYDEDDVADTCSICPAE